MENGILKSSSLSYTTLKNRPLENISIKSVKYLTYISHIIEINNISPSQDLEPLVILY